MNGRILLAGAPDGPTWSYTVDLDGDGSSDADGTLESGEQEDLTYRFKSPGIHLVRIDLRTGGRIERVERYVVVNDPGFLRSVSSFSMPEENSRSSFEGIAVSEVLNRLYLGEATERRIHMLSLDDFRLLGVADNLGSRNTLEGFAFDDTEQKLYVLDKSSNLQVFDGLTLVRGQEYPIGQAQHFIALTPMSVLWVSTPALIAWDDQMARTVLDDSLGVLHFDLFVEGEKILFSSYDGEISRVGVADAAGHLAWRTPLRAGLFAHVVAFSPEADFAYVLASLSHQRWKFLRLDVSNGTLDYEMDLGPCESACWAGAANPFARTAHGRFVVVPTYAGAFFIDTDLHLPRYRTPEPGWRFCCDVAAVGDDRLVFANGMVVQIDASFP